MTRPLHQDFHIKKPKFPKCLPDTALKTNHQLKSCKEQRQSFLQNGWWTYTTSGGARFYPRRTSCHNGWILVATSVGNQWLSSTGSNTPVRFILEVLVDSRRTLILIQDTSSHNSCSVGKKSFDEHLRFMAGQPTPM